jgi:hypothetical protein
MRHATPSSSNESDAAPCDFDSGNAKIMRLFTLISSNEDDATPCDSGSGNEKIMRHGTPAPATKTLPLVAAPALQHTRIGIGKKIILE